MQTFNTSNPVVLIISLALLALQIIAMWIVYRKADEHGWAAIIPFYNMYVLCRISGKQKLFWWMLILSIAEIIILHFVIVSGIAAGAVSGSSANAAAALFGGGILGLVAILAISIALLIIEIMVIAGVSVNFGHGVGYTIGLVLLGIIFWCILAFGSSKYQPATQNTQDDQRLSRS